MTRLYEANNHILIHTESLQPGSHRHLAVHIIISMGGSLRVRCDEAEYLCHGILLPCRVSHVIDTFGKPVLVFLYDCSTDVAQQIQRIRWIPEDRCKEIVRLYTDLEQNCTPDNYCGFEKSVFTLLGITGSAPKVSDDRILAAMRYIRSRATEKVTCQEVADAVHLSQGRFSHLFREQIGMTFAAYRIRQRILYVYTQILRGKSITEAALEAGFSSSAHFADVNRRVFGIPASAITRNLIFTKVQ